MQYFGMVVGLSWYLVNLKHSQYNKGEYLKMSWLRTPSGISSRVINAVAI